MCQEQPTGTQESIRFSPQTASVQLPQIPAAPVSLIINDEMHVLLSTLDIGAPMLPLS